MTTKMLASTVQFSSNGRPQPFHTAYQRTRRRFSESWSCPRHDPTPDTLQEQRRRDPEPPQGSGSHQGQQPGTPVVRTRTRRCAPEPARRSRSLRTQQRASVTLMHPRSRSHRRHPRRSSTHPTPEGTRRTPRRRTAVLETRLHDEHQLVSVPPVSSTPEANVLSVGLDDPTTTRRMCEAASCSLERR